MAGLTMPVPVDLVRQIAYKPCRLDGWWCEEHNRQIDDGAATCPVGVLHHLWITHDKPSGHPQDPACTVCGESCNRTTAVVALAYTFEPCDCGFVEYDHLTERLSHAACLAAGGAMAKTTRVMLESAALTLGRYKLGRPKADRIRAFLDGVDDDDSGVDQ